MSQTSRRVVLAERPTGMVDDSTTRIEEITTPELEDGQALVPSRYLSIDPTIRTWMDDAPGYLPPDRDRRRGPQRSVSARWWSAARSATRSGTVSRHARLAGVRRWSTGADGSGAPAGVDPTVALGVLGMTGHDRLLRHARRRPGQGRATPSSCRERPAPPARSPASWRGSRARRRWSASPAAAEKCAWIVEELGFDQAIDYRTEDVAGAAAGRMPARHRPLLRQRRRRDPRRLLATSPCGPGWCCAVRSRSTTEGEPRGPANYAS